MVYDEEMLESFYGSYLEKIKRAKMALARPLTLAEKILYAHIYDENKLKSFQGEKTTSTFVPIVWRCRMLLLRWRCCNL